MTHIEYEKRIVCYFDILGFGDAVFQKNLNAETIGELFKEIQEIIVEYQQDHIQISHFSDSFVISILHRTTSQTQLRFVMDTLIKLLEYKLTARGAIVYGEIIHTGKTIFGPALVKADCIEKHKAIYPRIILDESLDELPIPTIGKASITYRKYFNDFNFIKTDKDNEFYIDFISGLKIRGNSTTLTENIEELINSGIQNQNIKISQKYHWLKDKYECYLKTFQD